MGTVILTVKCSVFCVSFLIIHSFVSRPHSNWTDSVEIWNKFSFYFPDTWTHGHSKGWKRFLSIRKQIQLIPQDTSPLQNISMLPGPKLRNCERQPVTSETATDSKKEEHVFCFLASTSKQEDTNQDKHVYVTNISLFKNVRNYISWLVLATVNSESLQTNKDVIQIRTDGEIYETRSFSDNATHIQR